MIASVRTSDIPQPARGFPGLLTTRALTALALAGLVPLVSTPVHAAQYWRDNLQRALWPTAYDACRLGEAEVILKQKRDADIADGGINSQWRIVFDPAGVNEYGPEEGRHAMCDYQIQKKTGFLPWLTDTLVNTDVQREGLADLCPHGTLTANNACLPKMMGCPRGPSNGTNPCNGATGNKYEVESDYAGDGFNALRFDR